MNFYLRLHTWDGFFDTGFAVKRAHTKTSIHTCDMARQTPPVSGPKDYKKPSRSPWAGWLGGLVGLVGWWVGWAGGLARLFGLHSWLAD